MTKPVISVPTQQNIKQMHLKEIFLSALHSGGISRARLKQELRLSFPSVSALVDELLANRVLVETDTRQAAGRGRPGTLLRVNPRALSIPVAVLTREGYEYALYDCTGGCVEEGFLPFPQDDALRSEDSRRLVSTRTLCAPLAHWSRRITQEYRIVDLLLVIPGSATAASGLSSSALQMRSSPAFLPQLQEMTGWNVIVQNNSDCCAYAEKVCRPLHEDFAYIFVGNGVGAGIIRDGAVFRPLGARAGEIGHISIHYDGRPCTCGKKGCLETYISTPALLQDARSTAAAALPTFDDVCTAFQNGDRDLQPLFREKAMLLSVGIHNMLALQPVSHVILGGSILSLGPRFLDMIQEQFPLDRVSLSYAQVRSAAEALGAVWNYLDHLLDIGYLFPE